MFNETALNIVDQEEDDERKKEIALNEVDTSEKRIRIFLGMNYVEKEEPISFKLLSHSEIEFESKEDISL